MHPLKPQQTLGLLQDSGAFKPVPTGLAHGTITAHHLASKTNIEVTTLRLDQETDGRHASVRFTDDWRADAARRDFTFNALMLDMGGGLYDYFDGQADLAKGHVRFIGKPADRLAEDWLRGLRYLRFWGRYGQIPPNEDTKAALKHASTQLHHLSVERIWQELKGLIVTPRALPLFEALGYAGALGLSLRQALSGTDPVAAWAVRLSDQNDDFLERMKASKAEQDWFRAIRLSLRSSAPRFERQVRFGHKATQTAEAALGREADFPQPPPFPLRAQDLLDQGFAPGPDLGKHLKKLKDRWIASEGQLRREDLIKSIT